jgi:hypothetical protein
VFGNSIKLLISLPNTTYFTNMLTSNLLGLLAGLTIFAGQGFASPILARQDAAEGVVIGHDIQGMSRPILLFEKTG